MIADITPAVIAESLAQRAEEFARWLLPLGERVGQDWCVGSVKGEAGQSCKICVEGEKAGRWCDFAEGNKHGDLIDLLAAVRNTGIGPAMGEACQWLGIERPQWTGHRPTQIVEPARPENARIIAKAPLVAAWLAKRKISEATAAKFKLIADGEHALVFPSMRDGALLHLKYRDVREKKFWSSKGTGKVLFGWHALTPKTRSVILTEGEMDCLAFAEYGLQALSIPFGAGKAGKQDWIENEWEHLERFDTIFLAMDWDHAGQGTVQELIDRLGRTRVRVLRLPGKDANQCLMDGVPKDEVLRLVREAKTLDPEELRNAGEFTDEVVGRFYPKDKVALGFLMPWVSMVQQFSFAYGATTILAGYAGHGKALALDTPIATPEGWTSMGALRIGDEVFGDDGRPTRIIAVTEPMFGRPCFALALSDGTRLVADAEHIWKARQLEPAPDRKKSRGGLQRAKTGKLVTTKEIAGSLIRANHAAHAISTCAPLELAARPLSIDPYELGLWLGDGHSNAAYITMAYPDARECLRNIPHTLVPSSAKNKGPARTYRIVGLQEKLRGAGLLGRKGNKCIPPGYLRASHLQRFALLCGLMDTDGHVTPYGRCEFTSVQQQLAEDVLELALSLGLRARMIEGRATLNKRDIGPKYRITFTPWFPVFRLHRKAARCRGAAAKKRNNLRYVVSCRAIASVPVRCIQVAAQDGMFLAGKTLIPTHNSEITGQIVLDALRQGVRACVASFEFKSSKWIQRQVRQATGTPTPDPALIKQTMDWLGTSLWAVDIYGGYKAERMLDVFEYASRRYGIRLFVIDNFSKLGIADDDLAGQKKAINLITEFSVRHNVHTILIHHLRKEETDFASTNMSKLSLKGSSSLGDMVDNIFMCWRNRSKEQKLKDPRFFELEEEEQNKLRRSLDTQLRCEKYRDGDEEPRLSLWFDRQSHMWVEQQGGRPVAYVRTKT